MNDDYASHNPLDYVTVSELLDLGLTLQDIQESYQPSSGGVYHARGAESQGKTLWIAHFYRYLIDKGLFTPFDAVGNMAFKGKYAEGFETLKGENLRQYLWDMTHKPYKHKIVIVDECDSEFPARLFTEKEQTEIALRLWHTAKLGNYVLLSSHLGKSTDVIMHLASHFYVFPHQPVFATDTMDFSIANALDLNVSDWVASDVIKTMLIYNRRELTEETEVEQTKIRPSLVKQNKSQRQAVVDELDADLEWQAAF